MTTQEISDSSFLSSRQKAKRLSVILALCYLALPNILFCLGWLTPIPAIVVSCAIVFLVWHLSRNCSPQWKYPESNKTSKKAQIGAMLCVLLSLLLGGSLLIIGQQGCDWVARNPIFASLVRCDWPLILPDQSYFVYYLAAFLPPSLLARLCPDGSLPFWFLTVWNLTGIGIVISLMAKFFNKKVFLFFVLLMLIAQIGSIRIYQFLFVQLSDLFHTEFGTEYIKLRILGSCGQLNNTPHHIIPVWIMLALLFSKALNWREIVCASSLCVLQSPLGSIALFVLFVYLWMVEKSTARENLIELLKNPSFYCALPIVCVSALYFLCNSEGSSFQFVWDIYTNKNNIFFKYILAFLVGQGFSSIFILIIARSMGELKNKLMWFSIGLCFLFSILFIGITNNELLYKSSAVYFWITAYLFVSWLSRANKKQKILIIAFVCLSAVNTLGNFYKSIAPAWSPKFSLNEQIDAQHILSGADWHLYHPQHKFYPQFKGEIKYPWLFLDRAGASADTFFGWCRTNTHSDRETLPPPSPWIGKDQ